MCLASVEVRTLWAEDPAYRPTRHPLTSSGTSVSYRGQRSTNSSRGCPLPDTQASTAMHKSAGESIGRHDETAPSFSLAAILFA
jgi:hypothetical protein